MTIPDGVAEGWDAADAISAGWTTEDAETLINAAKPFRSDGRKSLRLATKKTPAHSKRASEPKKPRRSQRDNLIAAADLAELWHSPEKEAYATIPVSSHREHWKLGSSSFRRWLASRYYLASGNAPSGQALTDALRVLEAQAVNDRPEHVPWRRVGAGSDEIWIDLCDDRWRAVRITSAEWKIVDNPDVKFVRSETMAALPEPEAGGMIEALRGFVNADDDGFCLVVSWVLAALWGRGQNYPVLALGGEQGSGKSILSRLLVSLVDPGRVSAFSPPKDVRDLIIMATNAHVLPFDNISRVDAWLSDALCRLSTGAGFMTRKLHTDNEPSWFHGSRSCILNGIPALTDRADLADRALPIRLHTIIEDDRRPEDELWQEWEKVRPQVLGALCDALSRALGCIDTIRLDKLPRMADFAKLMVAAEPGLGWDGGTFLRAYGENRRQATEAVFENDQVAVAILKFITTKHPETGWQGTATGLLTELNQVIAEDVRKLKLWPKTANSLGNAVNRAAPPLRHKGIHVDRRLTGPQRLIILTPVK